MNLSTVLKRCDVLNNCQLIDADGHMHVFKFNTVLKILPEENCYVFHFLNFRYLEIVKDTTFGRVIVASALNGVHSVAPDNNGTLIYKMAVPQKTYAIKEYFKARLANVSLHQQHNNSFTKNIPIECDILSIPGGGTEGSSVRGGSQYIMKAKEIAEDAEKIYIIMENVPYTLETFTQTCTLFCISPSNSSNASNNNNSSSNSGISGGVSQEELCMKRIIKQMCLGLFHLLAHNIAHRNICLANILVKVVETASGESLPHSFLIGFDGAVKITRDAEGRIQPTLAKGFGSRRHFLAPEEVSALVALSVPGETAATIPELYLPACDVYAVGVVAVKTLTKTHLYSSTEETQIFDYIRNGNIQDYCIHYQSSVRSVPVPPSAFNRKQELSVECVDFLCGVLRFDAANRLTLQQMLAHPWLANID